MRFFVGFILCIMIVSPLDAQSLFESAVTSEGNDERSSNLNVELDGFIRGVFFGGKIPYTEDIETKSGYGEAALKFRVRKQNFGDAFAEIRYRRGYEFGLYNSVGKSMGKGT